MQLTSATFDAAVKENDPLLVAFVAPWCGHWCVADEIFHFVLVCNLTHLSVSYRCHTSTSTPCDPARSNCSKQLKPAYAAAAKVLAKDGLKIAQVDATAEADLASRFEVQVRP